MRADREMAGYQAVADLLTAMESAMGVDELAQLGAGTALQVLTAASASVSRFDAAAGSVRTLVNVGVLGPGEEKHPADERYRVSDFPNLLKVAEKQRPWSLHLHDEGGDPSEVRLLAELGKAASLGCPILVGARVWGEVYATRQHGSPAFTAGDEAVSRVVAQAIALGVGRVDSHEHLTELFYIDALTGLGNRRLADETLHELSRQQRPVAISLWDVDGLKTVNDRDGHLAGDRLLREIALLLSEAVSRLPGAVATRLGGDEFCLIVPGPVDAELSDALTDLVDRAGGLAAGAGLSCGTATVTALADDTDIRALMRRADAALYRAKRAGGRRQVRDLARPIAGPVSDISSPHHGDVTEG